MNYQDYKIILDTDIGDDIDDAFALELAMQTGCDLVAVTTVYKNTRARALQAKELIQLKGKDIPVYFGETYPLNKIITPFPKDQGDLATILPCQYDKEMEKYKVDADAAKKIVELAKQYSKKLVVVAIGPLTNLAKAFQLDPSIKDDIHAIYLMGGCFSYVQPEWNVLCDAEATQIVYESGAKVYSVGFDTTIQCPLDGSLLQDLRKSNNLLTSKVFTWFDRWMDYFHFEKSVLHDPLALSSFIDPEVVQFKEIYAKVCLVGKERGAVLVTDTPKEGYAKIFAATSVDKERFFKIIRNNLN